MRASLDRGALFVAVARTAPLAVQLAATPFVVGILGSSAYSVWALMMTTVNLLMTADLGVVGVMQRYHGLSRGRADPGAGGRVTATVLAVLAAALVVAVGVGPLVGRAVVAVVAVDPQWTAQAREVFSQTPTVAVLQLVGLAFAGYLAANSRFGAMAMVSLTARGVLGAGIVVALTTDAGLRGLLVASFADAATAVVAGAWACRTHLRTDVRRPVHAREAGEIWGYAWRNQASALGFVAQRELDVLMAGVLLPAAGLATVAAAAPLTAAASFAPVVLLTPLFTELSVLAAGPGEAVVRAAVAAEHRWFDLVVPYALVVMAALPPTAVAWIGPRIGGVGQVSAVLALGFLASLFGAVTAVLVRALGQPGLETRAYLVQLVVKVALGVVGARVGGAVGLAGSGVVAAVAMVVVLRRSARTRLHMVGARPRARPVLEAAAVSSVLAVVAWSLRAAGWNRPVLLVATVALGAGLMLYLVGVGHDRRRGPGRPGVAGS